MRINTQGPACPTSRSRASQHPRASTTQPLHTLPVTFGIAFTTIGLLLLGAAWGSAMADLATSLPGVLAIMLLLWTAVACWVASAAWLLPANQGEQDRRVHWLYGKRPNGTRTWRATLWLLPFLLPIWAWWHLRRPTLTE